MEESNKGRNVRKQIFVLHRGHWAKPVLLFLFLTEFVVVKNIITSIVWCHSMIRTEATAVLPSRFCTIRASHQHNEKGKQYLIMTEILVLILQEPQGSNSPHFEKHCAGLQTPWTRTFINFHKRLCHNKAADAWGKRGKNRRGRGGRGGREE